MRAQHVSADIGSYINARLDERIASKKLKVRDDELRKEISNTLVDKADGMFQWINCQIDHLCKFKTHNTIREALKSLPKTLEDTYLRILQSIDEDYAETVRKLLMWLVRGARELTLKELASAIAIDPRAENENLDIDDQMDPEDIVGLCSSLLVVSDENKVSLAHFTVKEFLTSPRLKQTMGGYYIGDEDVHTELTEVCLTYLGYRDFDRRPLASVDEVVSFLDQFGFLEYASKSWAIHAHKATPSENLIHGLVEQLFHSSAKNRSNYDLWLQVYHLQYRRNTLNMTPPIHASPLYYASLFGLPKVVESLLDQGAEPTLGNDKKDDPLFACATEGHADVIEILLKRCFEGEAKEKLGRYLYSAASKGHGKAVEVFLKSGAPIESKGGKYGTPLQVSALEGHVGCVDVLLRSGANLRAVDTRFGMPLAAAAEKGHRQVAQLLLDSGAPVNGRGGWYSTPLVSAIVGKDDSIIHKMLDNGANVNIQGGRHDCALMAAAALGRIDLVKKLIDLGAKVNDENDKGADALHSACCAGRLDVVELLLASGADVNAKGGKHRNALNAASAEGHLAIVQRLLAAGADAHANDPHYGNCLQAAAFSGYKDIVRVLVEAGVDVNEEGGVRGTALVSAASSGDIEMIDLLVKLGVPTGSTDDTLNALAIATWKQNKPLIQHMLDLGAEVDSSDDFAQVKQENWTPLSIAAFKGNIILVEMFLGLGADVNAEAGIHGTALIAAIDSDHCNHKVVEALLAAGADFNEGVDPEDRTHAGSALVAAVRRADIKAITILLHYGVDVNMVNDSLYSPLMEAVNMANDTIIDMLIEKGADVNLTIDPYYDISMDDSTEDDGVATALEVAALKGYVTQIRAHLVQPRDDTAFKTALQCAAYYGEHKAVATLLELGSDVHVVGGTFGSALQAAVCSGSKECVTLLLESGAKINESHIGKHGSALIAACIEEEKEDGFNILMERGVDPNTNAGGKFPYAIIAMAYSGDVEGVKALLKAGADVRKYGGMYHSAIQASAEDGNWEIAEILLEAGADINACGGFYGTVLESAYRDGYFQLIWKLYHWGASNTINGGTWGSVLGSAIGGSCHTLVHQLVESHNVNVNQTCGKWGSPLHFVILHRNDDEEELVDVFLGANADVNAVGGCYSTPLGAAVAVGKENVYRKLLDKGADPNLVDGKSGRGPLFLACREQKYDYVKQLIERGADVNSCTKRGSVLQSAAFSSDRAEGGLKIIQYLISCGAELNAVTEGPHGTALNAAAKNGDVKTIKWMLKHGADFNLIGGPFGSALQAAAFHAPTESIRFLLKSGADVNQIGGKYRTALQAACAAGNTKTAKLLLKHGADPNIKGGKYGTALQAACVARNTWLVQLLLSRGADPKIAGGRYANAFTAAVMMNDNEVVKALLAEPGVAKDMLGERKAHYKDHLWKGCEEFINTVLEDKEPLEEFDESFVELSDESEYEDTDGELEGEAGKEDENDDWETDGEEAREPDVEEEDDMDGETALSWLKVDCGPGGDFDAEE
ncbi:Ankyrin repeat domain-containing protein [Lachnellula subtilissima]|uniref:Ankyrin repeat domain-containing protein n=1 Tax=Lachnellula subtilissima TaxID=602034 RepID=A0A8H8RZA5_9HELO|nr:Ankyrin repeat domain-containing protein [Lachnellula subtilissima]